MYDHESISIPLFREEYDSVILSLILSGSCLDTAVRLNLISPEQAALIVRKESQLEIPLDNL
jgi:hypothetical protein